MDGFPSVAILQEIYYGSDEFEAQKLIHKFHISAAFCNTNFKATIFCLKQ
jgi:hypothetical protein